MLISITLDYIVKLMFCWRYLNTYVMYRWQHVDFYKSYLNTNVMFCWHHVDFYNSYLNTYVMYCWQHVDFYNSYLNTNVMFCWDSSGGWRRIWPLRSVAVRNTERSRKKSKILISTFTCVTAILNKHLKRQYK